MRVAPWPEAIREAEEVRFVDQREHRHHGLLDNLVLQRRDAKGTLLAIHLGDVPPARRQCPVAARLHRIPQLADPLVESFLVLAPPHPINAGRRAALQLHEAVSQQLGRDVVQQRREPYLLPAALAARTASRTPSSPIDARVRR